MIEIVRSLGGKVDIKKSTTTEGLVSFDLEVALPIDKKSALAEEVKVELPPEI